MIGWIVAALIFGLWMYSAYQYGKALQILTATLKAIVKQNNIPNGDWLLEQMGIK